MDGLGVKEEAETLVNGQGDTRMAEGVVEGW